VSSITLEELRKQVLAAAAAGKFVTPKHDPADIGNPRGKERSVFTVDASSSLCELFASGSLSVVEYQKKKHSDPVYVVEPLDKTVLHVAEMVASGSKTPSGSCDRILVYSGSVQGWHGCGESQAVITQFESSGSWTRIGPVK
jgi:hypothetical protein